MNYYISNPDHYLLFGFKYKFIFFVSIAYFYRIGHGAFLLCMESLYEKLTDQPIKYKALVGKPSEITYRHAERVLNAHAEIIGIKPPLKRIYCIG